MNDISPLLEIPAASVQLPLTKHATSSIQNTPAQPVHYYSSISARCWCGATILRRADGYWHHGATVGLNCPEPRL